LDPFFIGEPFDLIVSVPLPLRTSVRSSIVLHFEMTSKARFHCESASLFRLGKPSFVSRSLNIPTQDEGGAIQRPEHHWQNVSLVTIILPHSLIKVIYWPWRWLHNSLVDISMTIHYLNILSDLLPHEMLRLPCRSVRSADTDSPWDGLLRCIEALWLEWIKRIQDIAS